MAQDHLDRLSSVDASFLHQEDGRDSHMHIGGLAILEGPAFSAQEFTEHVLSRLHVLPRYRQKLAFPPFGSGRPLWVDDPSFNIEYHVRVTALPAPGTEEQLLKLAVADHQPAAGPQPPAVGAVDRRGPRGRPARDDQQDPPRAARRGRRAST